MAELYFTSDTHSYVYPTDYISEGRKNMGYMALSSSFAEGAIIVDGGDVLQGSPLIRYEMKKGSRPFLAAEAAGWDLSLMFSRGRMMVSEYSLSVLSRIM